MTYNFASITEASPIALAWPFGLPTLNVPDDRAVVSIRKALAELPTDVLESTLEEISVDRMAWDAQLATYCEARRISDIAPDDDDPELELVNAYMEEQDKLFVLPAPDAAALALKVELFKDRFDEWISDLPLDELLSDALRLITRADRGQLAVSASDASAGSIRPPR